MKRLAPDATHWSSQAADEDTRDKLPHSIERSSQSSVKGLNQGRCDHHLKIDSEQHVITRENKNQELNRWTDRG